MLKGTRLFIIYSFWTYRVAFSSNPLTAWEWFFRVWVRPSSFPHLSADARGWKPALLFTMWTCERLWEGSISNRLLLNYLAICLAGNLLLEFSTLALKMHFWNLCGSRFFGLIAMGKSEGGNRAITTTTKLSCNSNSLWNSSFKIMDSSSLSKTEYVENTKNIPLEIFVFFRVSLLFIKLTVHMLLSIIDAMKTC